jgi:hypothetical protein
VGVGVGVGVGVHVGVGVGVHVGGCACVWVSVRALEFVCVCVCARADMLYLSYCFTLLNYFYFRENFVFILPSCFLVSECADVLYLLYFFFYYSQCVQGSEAADPPRKGEFLV